MLESNTKTKTTDYQLLVLLGATATGKTTLAANIASEANGEIISADSRQVYRSMNLGTGKDYDDYRVNGLEIRYHLIDIVDAGYKYNIFEYQRDFLKVYEDILSRNKFPILCGGTGLYIESVLKGYKLINVPENNKLRHELENKTMEELAHILSSYKRLHNQSDTDTKERAVRAIEIEMYYAEHEEENNTFPSFKPLIVGINYDAETRRHRITERLKARLGAGMIDEVKELLNKGIEPEDIIYYGLEYKFITLYITGQLSYQEMFTKLEIAIHQFAKRQMTWFRHMERNGMKMNWIDGQLSPEEKLNTVLSWLNS